MGGKPGEAQPVLLGITKASRETENFLSEEESEIQPLVG
jgi:hypothetical protein